MTQSSQTSSVHLSGLLLLAGEFEDTVGESMWGLTPPQTPPLRGEGLSGSPFPSREGGWGVR